MPQAKKIELSKCEYKNTTANHTVEVNASITLAKYVYEHTFEIHPCGGAASVRKPIGHLSTTNVSSHEERW